MQQDKGRGGRSFTLGGQGRLLVRCPLIRGFKEETVHECRGGGSTVTKRKLYKSHEEG